MILAQRYSQSLIPEHSSIARFARLGPCRGKRCPLSSLCRFASGGWVYPPAMKHGNRTSSMGIFIWDNYRVTKWGLSSAMFDERRVKDSVYNMMGVVIGDILGFY